MAVVTGRRRRREPSARAARPSERRRERRRAARSCPPPQPPAGGKGARGARSRGRRREPPSSPSASGLSAARTPSNAITLSPPAGFNRCRVRPDPFDQCSPRQDVLDPSAFREIRQADRPAGPSLREIQDPAAEVVVADPGGLQGLVHLAAFQERDVDADGARESRADVIRRLRPGRRDDRELMSLLP